MEEEKQDSQLESNTASIIPMTYGEKAVGLTFNPSESADVNDVNRAYAGIIDGLNNAIIELNNPCNDSSKVEKIRLFKIAITEAQTAQMWAVKAITWK